MEIALCRSGSDDILDDAGRDWREPEMRKGRIQRGPLRGARAVVEMVGGQASWC